jgi:hypothetical protein
MGGGTRIVTVRANDLQYERFRYPAPGGELIGMLADA